MPPKRAGIKRRLREVDSVDPVAVLPTPPATSSDAASSSGRGEEDASSSDDEDYMAAEIDAGSDDSDGSEEGDHDDDDDDDDDEVLADEDRELSEAAIERALRAHVANKRVSAVVSASRKPARGTAAAAAAAASDADDDDDDDNEDGIVADSDSDYDSEDDDQHMLSAAPAAGPVIVPGDNNGIPWGGSLSDGEEEIKERVTRATIIPETDSDDSDAEEHNNTVGNIPMEWYNEYPHIGYDLDGKKIMRPATADELDKFLSKMDDPKFWTSVHDKVEQKDVELTEEELNIIHKLQSADYAAEGFDPYQDTVEWFTSDTMIAPLTATPEPKRRFVPSKWEHKKVMKIVRAIRNGWIVPRKPQTEAARYFDVWGASETSENRLDHPMHLPAPKAKLPGNIESYNPPAEYLFSEEERKAWEETEPEHRKLDFIPQKYDSLRKVPAYERFVHDRFNRCLDLYLCPRVRKTRVEVDPESLIPKLPDPKDLEPFPTSLSLVFRGHVSRVRTFSLSPSGQFLLTGADDGVVRLWELATTRCLHQWQFEDGVTKVSWNPSKSLALAAVAAGNDVHLLHLSSVADGIVADKKTAQQTLAVLQGDAAPLAAANSAAGVPLAPKCEWQKPTRKLMQGGAVWTIKHQRDVVAISWHRKGDYFVTVAHNAGAASVQIHQLSRKQTQQPFKKNKGLVITAHFHPTRPQLLIATQRHVRIYDLQQQTLLKKLMSGCKWIASMDVHPGGEHVIVGSYDKRLCWWDLDLGTMPYKTLRYHKEALRSVVFHAKLPLFASASDDGTIQVFHGMVYSDLLTNPLIVPVKILRAHQPVDSLGALNLQWHPTQPWLISSGADGSVKLWT